MARVLSVNQLHEGPCEELISLRKKMAPRAMHVGVQVYIPSRGLNNKSTHIGSVSMTKIDFTPRGKGLKFLPNTVCETSTPTVLNGRVDWLKLTISIELGLMLKINYAEYLVFLYA
jgi:hypothetical protein